MQLCHKQLGPGIFILRKITALFGTADVICGQYLSNQIVLDCIKVLVKAQSPKQKPGLLPSVKVLQHQPLFINLEVNPMVIPIAIGRE